MKWFLALALAVSAGAAGGPRLFFSRSFPPSVPAYLQVTLDREGGVAYREAPDDDDPLQFRLSEAETGVVFGLAAKLEYFKRPLEAPAKVAFTGTKTFRYEDGAQKREVQFNYTQDASGRALLEWFERIGETARLRSELERTAKYDRLGVVSALLALESAVEHKQVVTPDQFLPLLDRVTENDAYMHTARERAAKIAGIIRGSKP